MSMYRGAGEPDLNTLFGEGAPAQEQGTRQRGKPRSQRRVRVTPPDPRKSRPEEVSERVWGLAEQWVEVGTAALGKRPPVNTVEFSKRLADTIEADKSLRGLDFDYINDVLARAVEMFWEDIEVGTRIDPSIQFAFLGDAWDGFVDAAKTSIRVRHLKARGRLVSPSDVHRDRNPYLAAVEAQKERLWLEKSLSPEHQEPRVSGTRSDSLNRFRNK